MLITDDCNYNSLTNELNFGSDIIVHEHDFGDTKINEYMQKLIICLTCGLLYCEKCGKLLVPTATTNDKKVVRHNNCYLSITMSKE
jgi:hypothetical protein